MGRFQKAGKYVIIAMILLTGFILSGCSCGSSGTGRPTTSGSTPGPGGLGTLVRIEISPPDPRVPVGTQLQFVATGIYEDKSMGRSRYNSKDITSVVEWKSHDTSVATISNEPGSKGLATFIGPGTLNISASLDTIDSEPTSPVVTQATLQTIQISPMNPSLPLGRTQTFTAIGVYTDGTTADITDQVTWASSDTSIAPISNSDPTKGVATAVQVGNTDVMATLGDVSSPTSTLTVTSATLQSINVTPTNPTIANGAGTQQFTALGTFSDGTVLDLSPIVNWSTADTNIATIDNNPGSKGLATPQAVGVVSIIATDPITGVTGTTDLTVADALMVSLVLDPLNPSIAKGTDQQFTVWGTFTDGSVRDVTTLVVYSSDNTSAASVSNADGSKGLAFGEGVGTANITATDPVTGVNNSTQINVTAAELVSIQVEPEDDSTPNGTTKQYTATGTYTDGSTQNITDSVTWTTENPGIASIQNGPNDGLLTANAEGGPIWVRATDPGTGIDDETDITVTPAVLDYVQINETNPSTPMGVDFQFSATGVYTDGGTVPFTDQVTWSSSLPGVASIDNVPNPNPGLATPVSVGGPTVITATHVATGKIANTNLTVVAAEIASITISPATTTVPKGYTQQYTATAILTDGSNGGDVTNSVNWNSSNTGKASINGAGLATSMDTTGSSNITATFNNPITGLVTSNTAVFNCDAAAPDHLEVTPENSDVPDGFTKQMTAEVVFSDGTRQDVTDRVNWTTGDGGIASISNAPGTEGLATGEGPGTTSITATDQPDPAGTGFVDSTNLTVNLKDVQSLLVEPNDVAPLNERPKGLTFQYKVTATFTDSSTLDVTDDPNLTWVSSVTGAAAISNGGGTDGLVTAVSDTFDGGEGAGKTTITAQMPNWQGTVTSNGVTFTTTAKEVTSIDVTPASDSEYQGIRTRYNAVANYTDGSSENVRALATWSSNNVNVAVTNSGEKGWVTGLVAGEDATITVNYGGVNGTATFETNDNDMTSISLTPAGPLDMPEGTTQQFTATANYADGHTEDITNIQEPNAISWDSTVPGSITISGSGLATSVNDSGTSNITATWNPGDGDVTSNAVAVTATPAVLASIDIDPYNPSAPYTELPVGGRVLFTATGNYSDGSTQDLTKLATWASDAPGVVSISNEQFKQGYALGESTGTANITASYDPGTGIITSPNSRVDVSVLTPLGIIVTPSLPQEVPLGGTQPLTAIGLYPGGVQYDITEGVEWTSSNPAALTVSDAAGSKGRVTAVSVGNSTITATLIGPGISGSVVKSGTDALTIADVSVTPDPNPSTDVGTNIQFKALGNFSNGEDYDITNSPTTVWTVTPVTGTATIPGNDGLVVPSTVGDVIINAQFTDPSMNVKSDNTPPTLTINP